METHVWTKALEVFAVGITGVFISLMLLQGIINITSLIVRLIEKPRKDEAGTGAKPIHAP